MLWIALTLLALLLILLFIPICLRAQWDGGEARVGLRLGPAGFTLYPPSGKRRPKADQKKKGAKGKKSGDAALAGEKAPKRFRLNREQIFYSLETLPPILGRALRRVGRRIRIAPLKVHVLVAGTDPADTALLYGRLAAALETGLPLLHRALHIREQDICLFPDFRGEKMEIAADVGVSLRLGDLLVVLLCAGGSLLKWFLTLRKLSSPQETRKKTGPDAVQKAGAA